MHQSTRAHGLCSNELIEISPPLYLSTSFVKMLVAISYFSANIY